MFLEIFIELLQSRIERPLCLIAGGETTVTIRGDGKGGRNQELALAAVPFWMVRRMKCWLRWRRMAKMVPPMPPAR